MEKRKEIGKRIQQLRKSAGISQEELSVRANYKNRSSIARIENGSTDIPAEKLRIIAELLGTNTFYLETGINFSDFAYDPERGEKFLAESDERAEHIKGLFSNMSVASQEKVIEFAEYLLDLEHKVEEAGL